MTDIEYFTFLQNPVTDHLPVNTIKLSAFLHFIAVRQYVLPSFRLQHYLAMHRPFAYQNTCQHCLKHIRWLSL
jgi:hypothetical protein